jgi:DNA-binding phage protein
MMKSTHRMLSRHANPTSRSLFTVTHAISKDLGLKLKVAV